MPGMQCSNFCCVMTSSLSTISSLVITLVFVAMDEDSNDKPLLNRAAKSDDKADCQTSYGSFEDLTQDAYNRYYIMCFLFGTYFRYRGVISDVPVLF